MDITLDNRKLTGTVKVIQSKSYAHRILLGTALAELTGSGKTEILLENDSEDIQVTRRVTAVLSSGGNLLDCGESGTTLRFMVPVCAALGLQEEYRFTGRGRLLQRPMEPLLRVMAEHGVSCGYEENMLFCRGRLTAGGYTVAANVSSQYISGLLFALPLLEGDSVLHLTGRTESRPYIDITLDVLKDFGIVIHEREPQAGCSACFEIPGGQSYRGPAKLAVEGDWSNAAFWLAAGAVGGGPVTAEGLNMDSVQGDRAVCDILQQFGAVVTADEAGSVTCSGAPDGFLHGCEIDARDIPDLVPVISAVAAAAQGNTKIYNAGRLRMKESDRLATVSAMLTALGGCVEEGEDWLLIHGSRGTLNGGTVDGANDHRIVMSGAVAAAVCSGPVTLLGAEAVNKSYPEFFEEREKLL